MFEFGRDLRRILGQASQPFRDGLTGGDASLLELLDLDMLRAEAKACDIAAGRIGAKDVPALTLEAAIVWRELARRTGDVLALRKAAAKAETSAAVFTAERRTESAARARVEQALCAMLGADLFGDTGLDAAAEAALGGQAKTSGLAGALVKAARAALVGRRALASGGESEALAAAAAFDEPIAALSAAGRRYPAVRIAAAEARLTRIDMLAGCGSRLRSRELLEAALGEAASLAPSLDANYEPVSHARAKAMQGAAAAALGELTGDVAGLAEGVKALAGALEIVSRDHSPLDWAQIQTRLGTALQIMGEAVDQVRALEQAVTCFDRANLVLRDIPALTLGAQAANGRAVSLARLAELTGDLAVLDAAEAAFKTELSRTRPAVDPVNWAVAQLNLAQVYEARSAITGRDGGERGRAAVALSAALDVFGEQGLRSLSDLAARGLERLRDAARAPERRAY